MSSFHRKRHYSHNSMILITFKGIVSRDFLLLVFFMNQFPPAPEYLIRTDSNFSENLRRYSLVKVHHRYQRHRRQILPPVLLALLIPVVNLPQVSNNTGGKFAAGVNETSGNLPPVSTTPAANLPPGSMTPAANNGNNIRLLRP